MIKPEVQRCRGQGKSWVSPVGLPVGLDEGIPALACPQEPAPPGEESAGPGAVELVPSLLDQGT